MEKDITIVVPHRDSVATLPRLLESIPISERIEIIIIDNSDVPISKDQIVTDRSFKLRYSPPVKYAGGARNVGLREAEGKWLIFADSDDFFTQHAFECFMKYVNSDYDLVYFGMQGVYNDDLTPSHRGELYTNAINSFLNKKIPEIKLRLSFDTPCSKMVRKSLIDEHHIEFDEIVTSNDAYFSLMAGFYSRNFTAESTPVYVATSSRGSLMRRNDYAAIKSRYCVALKKNAFLKSNSLSNFQGSVMIYLFKSFKLGPSVVIEFIKLLLKNKQNPFVGYRNWIKTGFNLLCRNLKNRNHS